MRHIFKLPDGILDGEIQAEEVWSGCAGGRPEYHLPGGFTLLAPAGQPLDRIKPPLPDEPPVGAYRVGGVLCMRVSSEPEKCWVYQTKDEMFSEETFAGLCSDFGTDIVPLVPDPFAEPVELPWRLDGGDNYNERPWGLGVESTKTDLVLVLASIAGRGTGVRIDSGNARDMARALMAAADAAEKEQP